MTTAVQHPEPFGLATVSDNLPEAMRFYTAMYPYEIKEEVFAGIKFFSILKDSATIVTVFERTENNPIHGTIPILKVDSVARQLELLRSLGGNVIIPETTCPCTDTSFALCADTEGNQFILKEPVR